MEYSINQDVLVKYFSGLASPEEAMRLEEWKMESEAHLRYFEEMFETWSVQNNFQDQDVNESWQELQLKLGHAPMFVKSKEKRKHWLGYAAAVLVLVFGVGAWWVSQTKMSTKVLATYIYGSEMQDIVLEKGNVVRLMPEAVLSYKENDSVGKFYSLNGDAFFSFQNKMPAFLLQLPHGIWLRDIGTEFEISGDTLVKIEVRSGRVEVWNQYMRKVIAKNEVLTYHSLDHSVRIEPRKINLHFVDQSLEFATTKIGEYFHINIDFQEHQLQGRTITLDASSLSLKEALDIIAMTLDLKYEIENDDNIKIYQ